MQLVSNSLYISYLYLMPEGYKWHLKSVVSLRYAKRHPGLNEDACHRPRARGAGIRKGELDLATNREGAILSASAESPGFWIGAGC